MRRSTLKAGLAIALTAASANLSAAREEGGIAGGFDLSWHTIDCGGATFSVGGSFELGGTIGQPDAGVPLIGGTFSLTGGFWPGAVSGDTCPADINGDLVVNVNDLLAVISAWGAVGPNPADINADQVVNVIDLLAVISAWGTCP
ncbi:MAG: hypothetical protein L0Y44_10625 [Phycisphaerales bacterium]|nr:hypothetical protein [Phycisphaerales bacterium]MCI0631092.1 hypothetical protein [Phycisphaerales bacterium]MCI0675286.1 hypothetical protein [Phycisphaerales bacterium]